MKQWKLVLVALLAVLLVCACTSAMADETTTAPHQCTPDNVTVPATCGTDGSITRYLCSDPECPLGNYVKQVEVLYATGNHATSVNYKTDMPTCTEEGKDYFRCPTCLKNLTEKVIPATGHGDLTVSIPTPATCTTDGVKNTICTVCKEIVKTEVLPGGHKKVVNEYIKASCGVEGATIWGCLNGCGQTWTEVTAPALTHNFTVLYDHKDPTCTEDGHNIYACANNCGNLSEKEVIPAIGHNFTAVYDYVAPTCTTKGSETFACANNCGNLSETKEIPALGHTWKFDKTVAATCTEDGYDRYECEVCHAGEARNVVKASHNRVQLVEKNVEPTCTTPGSQTWKCTVCGSEDIVAVPVVDHVPSKTWIVTVAPSCTLEGRESLFCVYCGEKLEERAAAPAGHTAGEPKTTIANDCLNDGEAVICCEVCGMIIESVILPATGHDLEDEIIIDATCVLDGLKNVKCAECDYEELNVVIKAEGHKGEWKVTTPATPEADGQAKKICSVCEQELDRKVVPYTVMRYSNTATAFGPTTRELIGGKEWARVTPIDLSVEGTFTYPLIASNQYVIGTVTVTIANGSFVVNYDTAASQIKVTAEALLVYADKAALAAGTAEACAFGAPIQIGEDTKVILSVLLTVDYDAIGAGVTGFAADEAQIEAMKAIID